MPHCIIEYSSKVAQFVSMLKLMQLVHQAAVDSDLFDENDIKTRAREYEHYLRGDNKDNFICVVVKAMSGRNDSQKLDLANRILDSLKELDIKSTTITVEVLDMNRETYVKSSL